MPPMMAKGISINTRKGSAKFLYNTTKRKYTNNNAKKNKTINPPITSIVSFPSPPTDIFVFKYELENLFKICLLIFNKNTSLKISKQILNKFSSSYLNTKISVGGEGKETMDVIGGLIVLFFFALLLVYFLLVVLYKNFALPFLVFIEIPFAIMGGIIGLMIHDMNLTLLSVVGLIGLCGLAVNDNVIMIDFINETVKNDDGKKNFIDLVAYGAKRRLRPVILTTATTTVGFIPTIYGIGGSGGLVVPIA